MVYKEGKLYYGTAGIWTQNFFKIAEKLLGGFLISDMSQMRNPSQYGDQKGMSVNHCFIKMIHEILVSLDTNSATEKFAVFCSMIDWKLAFDTQCPTIGVKPLLKMESEIHNSHYLSITFKTSWD